MLYFARYDKWLNGIFYNRRQLFNAANKQNSSANKLDELDAFLHNFFHK